MEEEFITASTVMNEDAKSTIENEEVDTKEPHPEVYLG